MNRFGRATPLRRILDQLGRAPTPEAELADRCSLHPAMAATVIADLENGGRIERESVDGAVMLRLLPLEPLVFTAPRRELPAPPPPRGPRDAIDRIWASARVLKRGFDLETLALCAKADTGETASYARLLVRAGYLADRGDSFRVARDSGPAAPRRVITGMLDGNDGRLFALAGVADADAPLPRLREAANG